MKTLSKNSWFFFLSLTTLLSACTVNNAFKMPGKWHTTWKENGSTINEQTTYEKNNDNGGTYKNYVEMNLSIDEDDSNISIEIVAEMKLNGTWRFVGGKPDKSKPKQWKLKEDVNAPKDVLELTADKSTLQVRVKPNSIKLRDKKTGESYSGLELVNAGFNTTEMAREFKQNLYEQLISDDEWSKSFYFHVTFSDDGKTMYFEDEDGAHQSHMQ